MSNGQVQVGNFPFGGGGGASSVSNADGTLTISPTTGAVVASLNLANGNTWTGGQVFNGTVFFTGPFTYLTTGAGSAAFQANGSGRMLLDVHANTGLSGLQIQPTSTGNDNVQYGYAAGNGNGFTDALANDSVVSAIAGQTVRIGVGAVQTGTVASTVQVIATGITVTGTTVNNGDLKVNSSFALWTAVVRDTAGASVMTTAAGVATFPNLTNFTTGIKNNSAQTTVNGSTAGSIICSMPEQGTTYKVVVIFMSAMNGTAVYTFPTVFVHAPSVTGQFSGVTATPTTTNVTVTNTSALSGSLLIYGF